MEEGSTDWSSLCTVNTFDQLSGSKLYKTLGAHICINMFHACSMRLLSSNTNQLIPAAGAIFMRLGVRPLYMPLIPSSSRVFLITSNMPLYFRGTPPIPWACSSSVNSRSHMGLFEHMSLAVVWKQHTHTRNTAYFSCWTSSRAIGL